jgi:hypothetical protein
MKTRPPKAPRVPEKHVQAQIVALLRSIGAAVYVLGRPPRKVTARMGTGQTPGIPDLYVVLPEAPVPLPNPNASAGWSVMRNGKWTMGAHGLWIEVKAHGGRLRPEQVEFARLCALAGCPHLVGGVDAVLAYLQAHGYVKEVPHYRRTA